MLDRPVHPPIASSLLDGQLPDPPGIGWGSGTSLRAEYRALGQDFGPFPREQTQVVGNGHDRSSPRPAGFGLVPTSPLVDPRLNLGPIGSDGSDVYIDPLARIEQAQEFALLRRPVIEEIPEQAKDATAIDLLFLEKGAQVSAAEAQFVVSERRADGKAHQVRFSGIGHVASEGEGEFPPRQRDRHRQLNELDRVRVGLGDSVAAMLSY